MPPSGGPAGDSGSNSAWLEKVYCVLAIVLQCLNFFAVWSFVLLSLRFCFHDIVRCEVADTSVE